MAKKMGAESGELRGDKERMKMENELLEEFLKITDQKLVGHGTVGEIYCYTSDKAKAEVVTKVDKSGSPRHPLQNSLRVEFEMQKDAWRRVKKWQELYPKVEFATVPKPVAFLRADDGREAIVMERVRGKNLWHLALENYIRTNAEHFKKEAGVDLKEIEQACEAGEDGIVDFLFQRAPGRLRDLFVRGENKTIEQEVWRECYRKGSAIITPEQFSKILKFTLMAKREKFYHRDFHSRNVMIGDDGEVYVIDFGLSSSGQNSEREAMQEVMYGQDVMMTAGYDGLLGQLRESGNGEQDNQNRTTLGKWRTKTSKQQL